MSGTSIELLTGWRTNRQGFAGRQFQRAIRDAFVVCKTLENYGDRSLADYLPYVTRTSSAECEPRERFLEIVQRHTARLLGEKIARRTAEDLARLPVLLTANHHGVDFFAQSVQGTLAFSRRRDASGCRPGTVPVLACGAIPMNNLTYPRGLLIYSCSGDADQLPLRLPVFPDRLKRKLVSHVSGFDTVMVERAQDRAARLSTTGRIDRRVGEAVETVLRDDYFPIAVSGCDAYSDQSTVMNARIWKRLFRRPKDAPDLVYLELERLASEVVCEDLLDPGSVVWSVLFRHDVRDRVLASLDGHRAFWDLAALRARLETGERPTGGPAGTVFFWGIDEGGRRFPVYLATNTGQPDRFIGVCDNGARHEFPLDADSLAEALGARSIMPSVFLSYTAIALARGISCVGGYYQSEYLPQMQRAVADGLAPCRPCASLAANVDQVVTNSYLSGMQTVMTTSSDGGLFPAGALEIIAAGGLNHTDLDQIESIDIYRAHLASVTDTVADLAPELMHDRNWHAAIGTDLESALGDHVVVK